jgi:hypothetical protein
MPEDGRDGLIAAGHRAIGPRDKNDTLAAHVCWGAFVRRKSLLLAFQAREHRSLTQIKEQLH